MAMRMWLSYAGQVHQKCRERPCGSGGDVLELGHGLILPLRVVDLVETGPRSSLLVRSWGSASYLRIEERELEADGRAD